MQSQFRAKSQYVRDLQPKEDVDSIFILKQATLLSARDGKSYLGLTLSDQSGEIEARLWNGANEAYGEIKRGDYLLIKGKVNLFQGRKQLAVTHWQKILPEEINPDDFVLKSLFNPELMYEDLLALVSKLKDVYIRDLLLAILKDHEVAYKIKWWSAGKTIHHAFRSGLLEHILSCSRLGLFLSPHYQLNENFVVAGCILHDLCKIHELTEGPVVEYTDEGKLLGHLVKGVELVERFSNRMKNFPADTKLHLKHILVSHHGELEYGSPKRPQTMEAMLVHHIDLLDSRMGAMEMIRATDNNEGAWSAYVKHLDSIVYKYELPFYSDYLGGQEKQEKNDSKSALGQALKNFKLES